MIPQTWSVYQPAMFSKVKSCRNYIWRWCFYQDLFFQIIETGRHFVHTLDTGQIVVHITLVFPSYKIVAFGFSFSNFPLSEIGCIQFSRCSAFIRPIVPLKALQQYHSTFSGLNRGHGLCNAHVLLVSSTSSSRIVIKQGFRLREIHSSKLFRYFGPGSIDGVVFVMYHNHEGLPSFFCCADPVKRFIGYDICDITLFTVPSPE